MAKGCGCTAVWGPGSVFAAQRRVKVPPAKARRCRTSYSQPSWQAERHRQPQSSSNTIVRACSCTHRSQQHAYRHSTVQHSCRLHERMHSFRCRAASDTGQQQSRRQQGSSGNSTSGVKNAASNGAGPEADGQAIGSGVPEDWGDWDRRGDDWEDNADIHTPVSGLEAPQPRAVKLRRERDRRKGQIQRDEFMRPMVDTRGVLNRFTTNVAETERSIVEEFEDNRSESRAAVTFAGMLIGIPLIVGLIISILLAEPFLEVARGYNHEVFALTDKEKVEGAKEIRTHELRLRMAAAIGRSPPIAEMEMQIELRREAHHLQEEFIEHKRKCLLHLLSDTATGTTFFVMLLFMHEGRASLFSTMTRIFGGLSDTAKAFLIIASTDILLGYHSEEGWTAAIRMLTRHYGYDVENGPIYVFVAVVPVTLDALFKYWIFRGLNRQSPAAAVTLRNMDRH